MVRELTVELPADHPGVHDPEYRERRARIADVGARHHPGDPIPDVRYTAEEDAVWATVSGELQVLHQRFASDEVRRGIERLDLPTDRVPQLREVDARLADLYQAAGRASLRARSEEALELFSRVFWFTLEFGVVHEAGEVRAYGAGLLSSYGEIQVFRDAEIRPWDLRAMGTTAYDITHYQPLLFAAESTEHLLDELGAFFDSYDDDTYRRFTA